MEREREIAKQAAQHQAPAMQFLIGVRKYKMERTVPLLGVPGGAKIKSVSLSLGGFSGCIPAQSEHRVVKNGLPCVDKYKEVSTLVMGLGRTVIPVVELVLCATDL